MPNFVKVSIKLKNVPYRGFSLLDQFAWQLNAKVVRYLINEWLLEKKRTCAKFHIDTTKSKGLARVYTDGLTTSTQLVTLITYVHIYTLYRLPDVVQGIKIKYYNL